MKYATGCSGIEAPSVAWPDWEPQWFSEIEPFPCEVLNYHYPDVPNLGDFTKILDDERCKSGLDVFLAGTPCQSFSNAGNRKGLDDDCGKLALTFFEVIREIRPTWVVWENVSGVLSSNGGRDFGAFLGKMGECGYGWSYRILDAKYFGVPQQRRRVFLIGHASGDWRYPAAVLFDSESLRGNTKKGRKKKQEAPRTVSSCIDASYNAKWGSNQWIDSGFGLVEPYAKTITCGENKRLDPFTNNFKVEKRVWSVFPGNSNKDYKAMPTDTAQYVTTSSFIGSRGNIIQEELSVRRYTPIEVERLQGFPDNYTRIPYRGNDAGQCPDGPRYRAVGNSIATPVLKWIGDRIKMINEKQYETFHCTAL